VYACRQLSRMCPTKHCLLRIPEVGHRVKSRRDYKKLMPYQVTNDFVRPTPFLEIRLRLDEREQIAILQGCGCANRIVSFMDSFQ